MSTGSMQEQTGISTAEHMGPAVIDAHEIDKVYNPETIPVQALQAVHLHIEKGEFIALVGPSGSGKSTLLHIIGGLDKPTRGEVVIEGTHIHQLSKQALVRFRLQNIGFVFQQYNLIPVLTAWENTAFIMELQGRPKREIRERVESLLVEVGLKDQMHKRPSQLSGGQQQRVAVARALASRPRFILADEPTANLDSASAQQLLDMMYQMNREEKVTFLFSTHDPRVIERALRVITLVDGRVTEDRKL